MAELIGALVEAFAGLMMAVAEALPAILETLAYVAAGAITIIAYALSRRFRERKRQEWKHRPKSRYLELGIGSVCLGLLVALAAWILWADSRSTPPRSFAGVEESQHAGELRLTITKRSGENSNELKIAVPRGAIARLLHKKARRHSEQGGHQNFAGSLESGTNRLQTESPANGSEPFQSDTNSTPSAAGSHR